MAYRTLNTAFWSLLLIGVMLLVLLGSGLLPYQTFVVRNGSMSPTIPQKSLVLVHKNHFQEGDVITFRQESGVVTHRVVQINRDGSLVTKGDANDTPDSEPIPVSSVIGSVVAAPPLLGWLMVYLRSAAGVASVLLIITIIVVIQATTKRESAQPA